LLSIPLPFEEAVKAGLETPVPKRIEKAKKARVASRSKRKKAASPRHSTPGHPEPCL